ncbi:MAG: CDP-alcohol phosphatidyltransferase family protein, partial [Flavobacteriales bacterium]
MERIKKNIPNLITLGNLTCGLLSILFAFEGNLALAGALIFYGAILDFFDGFAARLLKVNSEIGKQLDSMADMVTFGVAPGILMYQLIAMTNENPLGIS